MVEGVMGRLYSRLARPYPLAKISESFRTIPTAQPGLPGLSHLLKILLILVTVESGSTCLGRLFLHAKVNTSKGKTAVAFIFISVFWGIVSFLATGCGRLIVP